MELKLEELIDVSEFSIFTNLCQLKFGKGRYLFAGNLILNHAGEPTV